MAMAKSRQILSVFVIATLAALAWRGLRRLPRATGAAGAGSGPRVMPGERGSAILPRAQALGRVPSLRGSEESLEVLGRARTFMLFVPDAPKTGRRPALVFVLHGDGGSGAGLHRAFPFERASGDEAVLVYPDAPSGWDLETTTDNRDVAFVERLIEALDARIGIDRSRVFGVGYSRGGFFANVFACQRAGVFRALSSSAGGAPYQQAETHANGYPKCPGQAPTAAIVLHGARDFGVTLDSGRFSAQYWAYVNGCQADEVEPTGYLPCVAYRQCPKAPVVFCTIDDLGHGIWGETAEASWSFFSQLSP